FPQLSGKASLSQVGWRCGGPWRYIYMTGGPSAGARKSSRNSAGCRSRFESRSDGGDQAKGRRCFTYLTKAPGTELGAEGRGEEGFSITLFPHLRSPCICGIHTFRNFSLPAPLIPLRVFAPSLFNGPAARFAGVVWSLSDLTLLACSQ